MKKIAIVGGGIAGLAAAYELERARKRGVEIDWVLYEKSDRLGGTVDTHRQDGFVFEGGPDGWVTDKTWARELALELGLETQLIASNDATRKTYILVDGVLEAIPDGMRMMVPEDLAALERSPLFSAEARAAYAAEPGRAEELRAGATAEDESVASFVRRHFGDEVLEKIGAPLLSGIFGGDVAKLSVQAVMPAFAAMERQHGSLIAAVQAKAKGAAARPIFTSLKDGVGSLVDALVAKLPAERLQTGRPVLSIKREGKAWCVRTAKGVGKSKRHFHHVLLAAPEDAARQLLQPLDATAAGLIPKESSSAVLVAFAWREAKFAVPQGFGFLVPQTGSEVPELLACTFVDQKFPGRVPEGGRLIRVFFGGKSVEAFAAMSDAEVAAVALPQLEKVLGKLPVPDASLTTVRRWPRSLPQYEVGHLGRMAELEERVRVLGGISLLGNAYRGVGLPDLIRDARAAARAISAVPPTAVQA